MITGEEVLPLLVDACPSFVVTDDPLPDFAHHLVALAARGEVDEFPGVFAAVELIVEDGDDVAVSTVRTGLIEDLQNIASHRDVPVDPEQLRPLLGPRATEIWDELEEAWRNAADADLGDRNRSPVEVYLDLGVEDRRRIQSMTRELPDGTLAAPSDILRYEADQYDRELGRWVRVMRVAPVVAAALVVLALVLLYAFA